jgi:hypothetical protein
MAWQHGGFETAAAAGNPVENALSLPLVYGGETVGLRRVAVQLGE